ncbi:hypothetical protein M8369_40205, partial [Klebsiella pneumoniae]|nr:hypothetical protein [Klebsiella pneumoniae]
MVYTLKRLHNLHALRHFLKQRQRRKRKNCINRNASQTDNTTLPPGLTEFFMCSIFGVLDIKTDAVEL